MQKKIMIIILILLMIPGLCFASDQPAGWAEESVTELKALGHFDEDLFKAYDETITRGEFIYMAVRMYEIMSGIEVEEDPAISFSDTDDIYALKGATLGITQGIGGGLFGYDQDLSREQLATFMVRVLTILDMDLIQGEDQIFEDDQAMSSWARESIYIARKNQIVSGLGNNHFNPGGPASKEMVMVVTNNILQTKNGQTCTNQKGQEVTVDIHQPILGYYQEGAHILKADTSQKNPNIEGNQVVRSLEEIGNDTYIFGSVHDLFNYAGFTLTRSVTWDYFSYSPNSKQVYENREIRYYGQRYIKTEDNYFYDVEDSFIMTVTTDSKGSIQFIKFWNSKGFDSEVSLKDAYYALLKRAGFKDFNKIWTNYYENGSLLKEGTLASHTDHTLEYSLSEYGYHCILNFGGDESIYVGVDDFEDYLKGLNTSYKIKDYQVDLVGGLKSVMQTKFGIEDVYASNKLTYYQTSVVSFAKVDKYDYYRPRVGEMPDEHTQVKSHFDVSILEGQEDQYFYILDYYVDGNSYEENMVTTVDVAHVNEENRYSKQSSDRLTSNQEGILTLFGHDPGTEFDVLVYNFDENQTFGGIKGPLKFEFYDNFNKFYIQYD